ncbi:MAG: hypothetical protein JW863_14335 [Chitinispirillaceae bacterium]|nr:hypothetical protein [Chitinispirillaceae bacterium]
MVARLIAGLFLLSLSSSAIAQIQEIPDSAAVTGIGNVFEVTTSDFINVRVESSNDIFAYVQSFGQQISINVAKPNPEILSTILNIKNLSPETEYNLVTNGRLETIVSDESGTYTVEVDLSLPKNLVITPRQ